MRQPELRGVGGKFLTLDQNFCSVSEDDSNLEETDAEPYDLSQQHNNAFDESAHITWLLSVDCPNLGPECQLASDYDFHSSHANFADHLCSRCFFAQLGCLCYRGPPSCRLCPDLHGNGLVHGLADIDCRDPDLAYRPANYPAYRLFLGRVPGSAGA